MARWVCTCSLLGQHVPQNIQIKPGKKPPSDMGWLHAHVLARDLNEHGDTNGTGDGDHIWHRFHRSVRMDLESPDLLPQQGHILGIFGHFILLSLPQDLSRSMRLMREYLGACHRPWYWRGIYPDYEASRQGQTLE